VRERESVCQGANLGLARVLELLRNLGGGLLGDVQHVDDLWVVQQRPLFRVQGSGCRVQGSGCRVQGSGLGFGVNRAVSEAVEEG